MCVFWGLLGWCYNFLLKYTCDIFKFSHCCVSVQPLPGFMPLENLYPFYQTIMLPSTHHSGKNILRHLSQALKHFRHCRHISRRIAEWKAGSEHLQLESERKKKKVRFFTVTPKMCRFTLTEKKMLLIKNIKINFRFTLSLNSNPTQKRCAVKCVIIHHKCILTWYLLTTYIYFF